MIFTTITIIDGNEQIGNVTAYNWRDSELSQVMCIKPLHNGDPIAIRIRQQDCRIDSAQECLTDLSPEVSTETIEGIIISCPIVDKHGSVFYYDRIGIEVMAHETV